MKKIQFHHPISDELLTFQFEKVKQLYKLNGNYSLSEKEFLIFKAFSVAQNEYHQLLNEIDVLETEIEKTNVFFKYAQNKLKSDLDSAQIALVEVQNQMHLLFQMIQQICTKYYISLQQQDSSRVCQW